MTPNEAVSMYLRELAASVEEGKVASLSVVWTGETLTFDVWTHDDAPRCTPNVMDRCGRMQAAFDRVGRNEATADDAKGMAHAVLNNHCPWCHGKIRAGK